MKHIDFIEKDLEHGFCVYRDGETVDLTEQIRACDHSLEVRSGCPRDMLSCPKCGWWTFAGKLSGREMEKYGIKDLRGGS